MPSLRAFASAAFARPALAGAAYASAFSYVVARRSAADAHVMGIEASDVTGAIAAHFGDHIHRVTVLIVALSLATGVLLGVIAGALVRGRDGLRGETRSDVSVLVRALPVIVALHASAIAYAMSARPQLYEDAFYAQGGLRRLLQVTCTDVLHRGGVVALALFACVSFLLPPRSTWPLVGGRVRRVLERNAATIALGLAVGLAAWGAVSLRAPSSRGPSKTRSKPNVLILAADSLRADRIDDARAPNLAAFRARAASFERAYVSLPRTFPSWVTLLTGRHPHHHGIRNMFPSRARRARDFDALPARLAKNGYRTAVVSDYAGDIFPRVALGFEAVDAPTFDFGELISQRALEPQIGLLPFLDHRLGRALVPSLLGMNTAPDAKGVASRTLEAIDRTGDDPFFVVSFFSTTHFPYAAPAPGYGRFTDASYRGRYKYEKMNRLGRELPPDDADVAQVRGLYDGAVGVVDDAMGTILEGLRARGLDDSTIVLVTADHGETLFENGRGHGHGDHLFGEEALRVPLLVRDGRNASARTIHEVTRDIDLAPSIYEWTGTEKPSDLDGASLAAALRGETLDERAAFAETGLWFTEEVSGVPASLRLPYPDISRMAEVQRDAGDDVVLGEEFVPLTTMAKHRSITTRDKRLILAPTREGLRPLLFDLAADPGCTRDLTAADPKTTEELRARLLAFILDDPSVELRGPHLVPRRRTERADRADVDASTVRLERR